MKSRRTLVTLAVLTLALLSTLPAMAAEESSSCQYSTMDVNPVDAPFRFIVVKPHTFRDPMEGALEAQRSYSLLVGPYFADTGYEITSSNPEIGAVRYTPCSWLLDTKANGTVILTAREKASGRTAAPVVTVGDGGHAQTMG